MNDDAVENSSEPQMRDGLIAHSAVRSDTTASVLTERHESNTLNAKEAHCFMNNSRNISCCSFLMVCAVAALANAADPDNQIYEKSPDERFGFRDSFAGAAKTESEMSDPMAIEVVEISSKRVVLPSPKEAVTPIHLRRDSQAWSNDSKHIALSFQTGPRTWTATLYEWDGTEFAQVSWPRDAIRKR
ncbi:MAG TPA: hypothetical protein VGH83_05800, partial [Candidatus Acidoferrum sp.]